MHSQRYIDAQNGVISRDIFVEKDVYDAELERISRALGCLLVMKAKCLTRATSSPPGWGKSRSFWLVITTVSST